MVVADRVIQAIGKVKLNKPVTLDSTFAELGIDSLDAIEVLFQVEEEFELSIPNEAMRGMTSVRDVVAGVERMLAGQQAKQQPGPTQAGPAAPGGPGQEASA
jgi:acyl carrier protein